MPGKGICVAIFGGGWRADPSCFCASNFHASPLVHHERNFLAKNVVYLSVHGGYLFLRGNPAAPVFTRLISTVCRATSAPLSSQQALLSTHPIKLMRLLVRRKDRKHQ